MNLAESHGLSNREVAEYGGPDRAKVVADVASYRNEDRRRVSSLLATLSPEEIVAAQGDFARSLR